MSDCPEVSPLIFPVPLQDHCLMLLKALLEGCGPPNSPALTGGLLRLAKELSWHSTNSPCMTLSLAVMRRLREAAHLGHFSDAGSPLTEQAADLARHMLHTFGEARSICLLVLPLHYFECLSFELQSRIVLFPAHVPHCIC
jgi:hypothetical protein